MILLAWRLALGLCVGGAIATTLWTAGAAEGAKSARPLPAPVRVPEPRVDPKLAGSQLEEAAGMAPFRASRRAPAVAYTPGRAAATLGAAAPPSPKPVLSVAGLVAGIAPAAIVEGLPGRDGPVVMRVGQREGGIRVARIEPTGVTLVGLDTVWVLHVRSPWQP